MSRGSASVPKRICLVRLSALGDVSHLLPVVHTLRRYAPDSELTWIIGRREAQLVHGLPGVELIEFDKNRGMSAYLDLRQRLRGRRFDALLQMQVSMRANLAGALVSAPLRVGFDAIRSRDCHGLFINRRIPHTPRQHVLESMFSFLQRIGIRQRVLDWSVPIADADRDFAEHHLPGRQPTLVISPCASTRDRNWMVERYVQLAHYAQHRHGMRVVLCGGPSAQEQEYGRRIEAALDIRPVNLIGQDTLKRFLALLERSDVLVSPDSGPAHIAACVGKPVIGLYATTNPRRCGPYASLAHCVDRHDRAVKLFLGRDPELVRWGTRVPHPNAMGLIHVNDVVRRLDRLLVSGQPLRPLDCDGPSVDAFGGWSLLGSMG